MLALGIILLLVAAGLVVVVVAGASPESVTFDLGAATVSMGSIGVFVTGAVTVLLLLFGLQLARLGLRRASRHRRDKKQLTRLKEETDRPGDSDQSSADTAPVKDPERPTS